MTVFVLRVILPFGMKMKRCLAIFVCGMMAAMTLTSCRSSRRLESAEDSPLGGLAGALVVVECASGRETIYRADVASTRFPPCSTFKIVNALVGLETGIVALSGAPFYQWDHVERSIPAWNRDLSLREAFQASCVPAFQELARQIGRARMQGWIDKLGYGNQDLSAGIDGFWLPAKGRNTILISPKEQVRLMQRVVAGDVPFSKHSLAVLKELMFIKETAQGTLYGKTGSGTDEHGTFVLGWFVGYVESKGRTYAFACVAQGRQIMSKDARAITEGYLQDQGWL